MSFGLGVYAPYGGNIGWPQNTGFRTVAIRGSLTYLTINPVVAVKLAPGLSIAAGAMVNYVDLEMEQGLLRTPGPFTNFFRFKGTVGAWVTIWVCFGNRIEKISLGATFRSTAKVHLDGQRL